MAGIFTACTFREVGSAATPQNIASIENIDGTKLVYVRKIVVQCDMTVALATVTPVIRVSRATGVPTGGTTLNKGSFDTTTTANVNTIVRGQTASDGGALSGPTATAGDTLWQTFLMRVHTAVGQILMFDSEIVPILAMNTGKELILRQNQALLVQIVAAAGGSNAATNHYIVSIVWEEN